MEDFTGVIYGAVKLFRSQRGVLQAILMLGGHFHRHFEAWRSFPQRGEDFVEEGIFAAHFAAAKWLTAAAKWHSCAKGWFRSCETPFEMAPRLRNSRSALRIHLQMAITFLFQLQIMYHLKN